MGEHEQKCPACGETVPAATFCGSCGADLAAPRERWTVLLRPKVFANAHREAVLAPRVTSTVFPRLPAAPRRPFRLALIAVSAAVLVLAGTRVQGPLGVIAVISWPLMFLIYVWQSDVFRDLPIRILGSAMLLGIALGVGSWVATSTLIAKSYGVSTGSSLLLLGEELGVGFLISVLGAVLVLVPAAVTRLFRVPSRESLDGFVIGAFGALWYSTAASTTVLAPQFAEGLIEQQTAGRMFDDAITYGIANAICATAAGGVVGLRLWFRADRRPGRNPRRARTALTMCAVAAVFCYLGIWAINGMTLPRIADIAGTVAVSVLALFVIRVSVQIALLHEAPDPSTGEPVLCVHCEHVVPDMPFCVACSAAARASSRSSRSLRKQWPPVLESAGEG